ncbi:MAG: Gfo/Idh/MocA family oxidoreductase [Verrucomicrobiales bacterium]|nr:Gfo/Idh/MocA family oxidoreductase [Verrucomicrobiales bacterium]
MHRFPVKIWIFRELDYIESEVDMNPDKETFGWGLIGPGRFAREFAEELGTVDRARLVAVASRDGKKSAAFAGEFGFERSYGNYGELFADEEVDVVYIVVPHVFHRGLAEEALSSGKAVLCEKPLTPSFEETDALLQFASGKKRFLMEAMKTGFLPAVRKAKQWIADGRIGEPRLLQADCCFQGPTDPEDRLMNPELAGGAVLDVGIYPLYLARFLLGEATAISAVGTLAETGVEDSVSMISKHGSGASAAMTCSFRAEEAMDAVVRGTEGEIRLPKFHAGVRTELRRDGEILEVFEDDSGGMVKAEIEAVTDALAAGLNECPGHSHEDSRALSKMMEEVRSQILP